MHAVAEDFAPRIRALVDHMKDPSLPRPKFTEAEKPMVFQVIGQMAAIDPSVKEAVELHNIREMAKQQVVTKHDCADKKCPQYTKPKSFWDNVGQRVSDVGNESRKRPLLIPLVVVGVAGVGVAAAVVGAPVAAVTAAVAAATAAAKLV
jgi:hypothetical protein